MVAIRLGRSLRAHASRTKEKQGVYVEERTGYPRGGGNTEARWERRETWARAQRYNKPHPLPWELPRPRTPHDAQRGYRALPHLGYSHSKAYHQRCHLSPTHRASPASGHCTRNGRLPASTPALGPPLFGRAEDTTRDDKTGQRCQGRRGLDPDRVSTRHI